VVMIAGSTVLAGSILSVVTYPQHWHLAMKVVSNFMHDNL
jgi:hypothetical protein